MGMVMDMIGPWIWYVYGRDVDMDMVWIWTLYGHGCELDMAMVWTWHGHGYDMNVGNVDMDIDMSMVWVCMSMGMIGKRLWCGYQYHAYIYVYIYICNVCIYSWDMDVDLYMSHTPLIEVQRLTKVLRFIFPKLWDSSPEQYLLIWRKSCGKIDDNSIRTRLKRSREPRNPKIINLY